MSIDEQAEQIRRKLVELDRTVVSIALFGQPGAGKSSIINKIAGKELAVVGTETDKTVDMACYDVHGLKFCDLPGYGTEKFPKGSFLQKFNIKEFDLFLCVTSGKLHQADTEFFRELARIGKVCIFVVNKHDELWENGVTIAELEQRKIADITRHVGQTVKILFTSCRNSYGFDALITEIQNNLPNAKRERWARSAKAYSSRFLQEKRTACEGYVSYAAWAAAANAINFIPGLDIAVDISIILKLFKEIRDSYGLSADFLDILKQSSIPAVGRLANNVVRYAFKEGVLMLLKNFAGRQASKTILKYIPFIGQAVSASIGYALTSNVGYSYLNDCHELAEEILKNRLGK